MENGIQNLILAYFVPILVIFMLMVFITGVALFTQWYGKRGTIENKKLNVQKQTVNNGCQEACIKTLCVYFDIPYTKPSLEIDHPCFVLDSLLENGMDFTELEHGQLLISGSLYLVQVPSLTRIGAMHMIIIDLRDDKIEVYDPSQGKGYSKDFFPQGWGMVWTIHGVFK